MKPVAAALLLLIVGLAACQTGGGGSEPVGEEKVEADRKACERSGGRFASVGKSEVFACFTTPKDSGKQCTKASDCESACLARSGTCAPVKPLLGCNEILNAAGLRMTECLQ